MGPQTTPDARLARLAARHYGVVSRAQLHELGFGDRAIARRVEAGRLHRMYRGVYAVGHTVVPPRGRWLAAVLACGDGAALCHRSAAALWGIRPTDTPKIDVTVSHASGVRGNARIAVHRSRRPIKALKRDGIPVTTAGQTLLDLATALPRRQLEKACEMAEALQLNVEIDDSHPGARRLREAGDHDLTTTTRSSLEDEFLELCDRHAIPRPRVNSFVGARGRLLLARGAADRRDRRQDAPHARRLRGRPRARRVAHLARLAGHALHAAPGAPRRGGRGRPRAQRA